MCIMEIYIPEARILFHNGEGSTLAGLLLDSNLFQFLDSNVFQNMRTDPMYFSSCTF